MTEMFANKNMIKEILFILVQTFL